MEALSGLGLHVLAELAVLVATVSYAFAGIFGRRFKAAAARHRHRPGDGHDHHDAADRVDHRSALDAGDASALTLAAIAGLALLSTASPM